MRTTEFNLLTFLCYKKCAYKAEALFLFLNTVPGFYIAHCLSGISDYFLNSGMIRHVCEKRGCVLPTLSQSENLLITVNSVILINNTAHAAVSEDLTSIHVHHAQREGDGPGCLLLRLTSELNIHKFIYVS